MALIIEKIKPVDPPYNPLGLEKVKNFLRINHSTDDSLINDLACAAVEHLENETGQAIIQRRWQLVCSNVSDNKIRLLITPVLDISEVKIRDQNFVKVLDKTQYYLQGNVLYLNTMIGSNALLDVIYNAGYSNDFCPYLQNQDDLSILESEQKADEEKITSIPLPAQTKSILFDMVNNMYDGKGCDSILNSDAVFQMRNCFL